MRAPRVRATRQSFDVLRAYVIPFERRVEHRVGPEATAEWLVWANRACLLVYLPIAWSLTIEGPEWKGARRPSPD